MKLEEHGRLHQETQDSIRILTDGINHLVQAEIRREQDKETFTRMAGDIAVVRGDIKALRADFEDYKDKQTEKELAAYRSIVWKVIGLAAVVIASVIAGHFGGKWLG